MRFAPSARLAGLVVVAALALGACGDDDPEAGDATTTTGGATGVTAADKQALAGSHADLVFAAYSASITSASTMQQAVEKFLAEPTDANLEAAKAAWLTARDDYGPTEAFRFYDGPIDNPDDGPEGQINAWPMDEAYVDYVEGDAGAGIINDTAGYPEITADVIVEANEKDGETNISTGWHAIEYLLWGQDKRDDGPGARPVSDYTTAPNAPRRATYLRLVTQQLLTDLSAVRDEWAENGGAYRAEFVADPDQALTNVVRGIGALNTGELAGERMTVAYETKDREDEHSCFSDNTNADVVNNLKGIRMVYLGEGAGVTGTGVSSLVAKADPQLDTELRRQLDAALQQAEAFPVPFEAMIAGADGSPGRTAMLGVINALEEQGKTLAAAAKALGVQVNFEV